MKNKTCAMTTPKQDREREREGGKRCVWEGEGVLGKYMSTNISIITKQNHYLGENVKYRGTFLHLF